MRTVALIVGLVCLIAVLVDAFQTIILPRRATGPVRLTRAFYRVTWAPWAWAAGKLRNPRGRETAFSFYGPLSLILLLVFWAIVLLFSFGLVYYAMGSPISDMRQHAGMLSDFYVSGTTLFTVGPVEASPMTPAARWLLVIEAGTGFGFLAVIMGYFPVLYSAFSRREVNIALLDARAGSPPTATELMRRHSHEGAEEALRGLLTEWERWSAELLESHISFPLLCYFRSQHTNQSWISALTSILDTCALLIAGVQGHEARQAQLTFAIARHALVDLSQVTSLEPIFDAPDRLPPQQYDKMYGMLCESGVSMCRDSDAQQRLREMRRLYEPYAETLSRHFCMPLPPWIPDHRHKDNWLAVRKVRQGAEEANPAAEKLIPGQGQPHASVETLHDDHHEF